MTNDRRRPVYPLAPLEQRERWRLEALQVELGAASRELAASSERHASLQRAYEDGARSAAQAASGAIDPASARNHLLHLRRVHSQVQDAARAVADLETSREQLRSASERQRSKVDTIGQHKKGYERKADADIARLQDAEADREWLARAHWNEASDPSPDGNGPQGEVP